MFYYTITITLSVFDARIKHHLINILVEHGAKNIIPATNLTFTFQSDETFTTWKNILEMKATNITYYFAQVVDKSDTSNYEDASQLLTNIELIRSVIARKKKTK